MATLARLQARSKFVAQQYYFRNSVVDIFRKKEYDAAVKIQSWFRGCQVRAHIRNLHRVATIIQKWWRSYSGRQEYQLIVKFASCAMKMNLYNAMAVRIQRRWRGYRIRKYCFNYFYLKEYLKAVSETNDAIREALEEFAEMKEREEKKADLEREEKKRDYQARKTHYLLSTKQGPFRDITEVLEQRYKPLEPTLWVAEPISELKVAREEFRRQEWMRDVNDNMFLPFSSYHKNKKYTPLMHSSSKYGPNSYGSQHFRDENPKKWICDKDFQTVLPSFDLFSKYGKLYSKAGQII
ncbi:spermatogenesis-associated protein 17 isoform X6 [Zalophus californianus]|uniref:Spermatogenesis-associated protein 17 isoform X6 n=1 Tax=Zalophus californianus TaxID=9704 RepID=A0A6J2EP37_ZALCA|nr:spermatogenesis-associated protein 17 isoform X6 [Zalophus californianus]